MQTGLTSVATWQARRGRGWRTVPHLVPVQHAPVPHHSIPAAPPPPIEPARPPYPPSPYCSHAWYSPLSMLEAIEVSCSFQLLFPPPKQLPAFSKTTIYPPTPAAHLASPSSTHSHSSPPPLFHSIHELLHPTNYIHIHPNSIIPLVPGHSFLTSVYTCAASSMVPSFPLPSTYLNPRLIPFLPICLYLSPDIYSFPYPLPSPGSHIHRIQSHPTHFRGLYYFPIFLGYAAPIYPIGSLQTNIISQ